MKKSFVLFIGLLSIAVGAFADQLLFRKTAKSSVTITMYKNAPLRNVVNTSFSFHWVFLANHNYTTSVLLEKKIEAKSVPAAEGVNSKLEVVAWTPKEPNTEKYDTKLWTINDDGDEGKYWGHFYRTEKYGYAEQQSTYRFYNIATGKYAFSCTTDPVFTYMPDTAARRTIAYLSSHASIIYDYSKRYPNGVGVLTIASDDVVLDRIVFEDIKDDYYISGSRALLLINSKNPKGTSELTLWNLEKAPKPLKASGFSVKLSYYNGVVIVIPVSNDRFDLSKVVLPASLKIRHIPVEPKK